MDNSTLEGILIGVVVFILVVAFTCVGIKTCEYAMSSDTHSEIKYCPNCGYKINQHNTDIN